MLAAQCACAQYTELHLKLPSWASERGRWVKAPGTKSKRPELKPQDPVVGVLVGISTAGKKYHDHKASRGGKDLFGSHFHIIVHH